MQAITVEDKVFDKQDFTASALAKADYENCFFKQCDFSGSNLSGITFSDTEFTACNFSLATLVKTAFRLSLIHI
jgi:fluoroquinolone resistance protein